MESLIIKLKKEIIRKNEINIIIAVQPLKDEKLEYRFFESYDGLWKMLKDYSKDNTCQYNMKNANSCFIMVQGRKINSDSAFDYVERIEYFKKDNKSYIKKVSLLGNKLYNNKDLLDFQKIQQQNFKKFEDKIKQKSTDGVCNSLECGTKRDNDEKDEFNLDNININNIESKNNKTKHIEIKPEEIETIFDDEHLEEEKKFHDDEIEIVQDTSIPESSVKNNMINKDEDCGYINPSCIYIDNENVDLSNEQLEIYSTKSKEINASIPENENTVIKEEGLEFIPNYDNLVSEAQYVDMGLYKEDCLDSTNEGRENLYESKVICTQKENTITEGIKNSMDCISSGGDLAYKTDSNNISDVVKIPEENQQCYYETKKENNNSEPKKIISIRENDDSNEINNPNIIINKNQMNNLSTLDNINTCDVSNSDATENNTAYKTNIDEEKDIQRVGNEKFVDYTLEQLHHTQSKIQNQINNMYYGSEITLPEEEVEDIFIEIPKEDLIKYILTSPRKNYYKGSPIVCTLLCSKPNDVFIKYELYLNQKLIAEKPYSMEKTYGFTPPNEGIYKLIFYAKKADGNTEFKKEKEIFVSETLPLEDLGITCDKSTIICNEHVTFMTTVVGGKNVLYEFYIFTENQWQCVQEYSETSYYTLTPEKSGTYKLLIMAKNNTSKNDYDEFVMCKFDVKNPFSSLIDISSLNL